MAKTRLQPLDLGAPAPAAGLEPAPFAESAGLPPAARVASTTTPALVERSAPVSEPSAAVWPAAIAAAVLWTIAVLVLTLGLADGQFDGVTTTEAVTAALLALGPAALILFCAAVLHQASRLAAYNARAAQDRERLLSPALLAAAQAGGALETVRSEIEAATQAAQGARSAMGSLAEFLSEESRAVNAASEEALRSARAFADRVAGERDQLTAVGRRLDDQAAAVTEAVTRQARMVSEAAELAQTQIRDAELSLSARAADLAAAAGEATDAARAAGGDLSRQTQRLETAARDLAEHVRATETGLTTQRTALAELGQALSGEQEAFAARAESQRQQLAEALGHARGGAQEIGEVSAASGQALQALVAAVAAQIADASEAVRLERERLEVRARDALSQLGDAAEAERRRLESGVHGTLEMLAGSAEQAGRAAAAQAEAARSRVEQLSEAAFMAGRQADDAFESRLSAARRMIDESATLVDEAGGRSQESLQAGLAAAREAVAEIDRVLAEVDARSAKLPAIAQQQAEAVRQAVEQGVEELQGAARRAAAETEAIESQLQERVRRNYQTLSEAVRLMGVLAAPPDAAPSPAPIPEPIAEPPPAVHPVLEETVIEAEAEAFGAEPGPVIEEPQEVDLAIIAVQRDAADDAEAEPADAALFEPSEEPVTTPEPPETTAYGLSVADAGLRPRLRYFDDEGVPEDDGLGPAVMALRTSARSPAATNDADEALFEPVTDDTALDAAGVEPGPEIAEGADEALFEPETPRADEPSASTLLETASGDDALDDEEALADRLATELLHMSVDPERLLPRARVEEISRQVHAGEREAARGVVLRLAPAAVRRLSRRLATDPALRADSARFVQRYAELLGDASRKDGAGYMTATLMASEAGRVWLLFDAAREA